MLRVDPHALVREQLALDERRCAGFPGIFEHKIERMRASPLAFLRGAAPLFYKLLRENPELARGPKGEGWIAGDLHLENFGAYRPASLLGEGGKKHHADAAAFDLNDFDDAIVGPWRLDVLRLTTSLLLGARELGVDGREVVEMAGAMLEDYADHACRGTKMPPVPRPVAELLARVRTRSRRALLDARTAVKHGERRFVRGPRYRDLRGRLEKRARAAFEAYVGRLREKEGEGIEADHFEVLDMAFRVAGTGSLGGTRIAVLVRGKGGAEGAWIFDMKEQGAPSASALLDAPQQKPAKRVVAAMTACLARPPRMLGVTKLDGVSMVVRRLTPQEDKLNLANLRETDLLPLARYLGALTGAAHRRGATRLPKNAWRREERACILDHAITIAGLHEAAYLAFCRQT